MEKKKRFLLMALLLCVSVGTVVAGSPFFSIQGGMEWQDALENGQVQPVMPHDWDEYMVQWDQFLVEGDPYPQNDFIPCELYVHSGPSSDLGEGLVMAWGNDNQPDGSFSSAWEYDYGVDPDLSNCTITISVLAPQFSNTTGSQINAVSFGMKDMNGNIRSWHWAVGPASSTAPIKWGVPTTITINTAVPGVAAANPVATGYMNNPGFNITLVQWFIVDENANWVGGPANVPPPGTIVPRPWNLWGQLSVTRHASNPIVVGTNIDVHMDIPGAIANDFHIEGRIESGLPNGNWGNPPVLVQHVDGPFPFFDIQIIPDTSQLTQNWFLIKVKWWGVDIEHCKVIHLGLKFEVTCHNIIIDLKGWWTFNGLRLADGFNGGFVPVIGFDVQDRISADPREQEPQMMQLRNGNGDGQQQDGEINTEIVQMDLVALPPEMLHEFLGPNPFAELRPEGAQEHLPWIPVGKMDPTGQPMPIRPENPQDFHVDSFFDVFFDIEIAPPETGVALGPVHLEPGDFLVSRQLLRFTANDGNPEELRWFFEIHEAHQRNNDLGDAPDSSNNFGVAMTAYPSGVQAMYPTVYGAGSPPFGPIHWMPTARAHLGRNVTGEREADIMFDMDPTNNIIPPKDIPDKDLADDGVLGLP
ncbi:MAG: hypothetical protein KAS23_11650, partial [Anaerohalosphaera sp.]|nr:hypothetical protein [Anaerohalosphaera sp.]